MKNDLPTFGVESTDDFIFTTFAKHLNDGLEGQLDKFIREHSDTRLIIIDTLQKVREAGSEKYSYANDYEVVTKLKQFSDRYGICILLVHHTRKQEAEDSFDTISGTNGLLGAADGAFIMQKERRTSDKATLNVVGRDQQDQKLYLILNTEHLTWELEKAETELWKEPSDSLLDAVVGIVIPEAPLWSGSASELVERLGFDIQPNVLTRRLNIGADRLFNEHSIRYECCRSHAGRNIRLALDISEA